MFAAAVCNLSPKHILVSTVGIPEAMVRFLPVDFPRWAWPSVCTVPGKKPCREQIIPLARRYQLSDLRAAVARVTAIQRQPVMIEYILLKDFNDTAEDVSRSPGRPCGRIYRFTST